MKITAKIPIKNVGILPKITADFLMDEGGYFTPDQKKIIELNTLSDIDYSDNKRSLLVDVLTRQYEACGMKVSAGVGKLKHGNTFAVTTGHQLCLFGGPLYVVYKIASTINLSRQLNEAHPEYNFVPVFWMATEDHDFEEVSKLNVRGTTINWQNNESGCVGRMGKDGLQKAFKELENVLDGYGSELVGAVEKSLSFDNVSDHYRSFIHGLFGCDELVVIDPDDKRLKNEFLSVINAELDGFSKKFLAANSRKLVDAGYKAQIKGRDINLFWIEEQIRERIICVEGVYKLKNGDRSYSKGQLLELFKGHPENVSPNVVLRPVYQQIILPNIVYIGGGSELAYWFQLEDLFSELGVHYPVLMARSSMTIVGEKMLGKWKAMGFDSEDLFKDLDQLKKELAIRDNALNVSGETKSILELIEIMKKKVIDEQPELEGMIGAETRKIRKQIEFIEKRLLRASKSKNEQSLIRIEKVIEKVKPGGKWQERYDSVFDYFTDFSGLERLVEMSDPTEDEMKVLVR